MAPKSYAVVQCNLMPNIGPQKTEPTGAFSVFHLADQTAIFATGRSKELFPGKIIKAVDLHAPLHLKTFLHGNSSIISLTKASVYSVSSLVVSQSIVHL